MKLKLFYPLFFFALKSYGFRTSAGRWFHRPNAGSLGRKRAGKKTKFPISDAFAWLFRNLHRPNYLSTFDRWHQPVDGIRMMSTGFFEESRNDLAGDEGTRQRRAPCSRLHPNRFSIRKTLFPFPLRLRIQNDGTPSGLANVKLASGLAG